jgi:hypothetical protein
VYVIQHTDFLLDFMIALCYNVFSQEENKMDLKTHNGTITLENNATGGHRTFKVSTVTNEESGLHGKRIISLLHGPDNTADYHGFGFVNPDGSICVWRKYNSNSTYGKYARILTDLENYPTITVHFEGRCIRCNRKLTRPDSITSGIGPECAKKMLDF